MYTAQLGQMVDSLLRDHPMVVIPGIGGIVRERIPAKLDVSRSRLAPPSESLMFNARLGHNDGLIVNTVAEKWGFGPRMADDWLTDAVSELRFALESGQRVQWPNVGSLSLSSEGRIHFVADADRTASLDFFGLRPLLVNEAEVQTPVGKQAVNAVRRLPAKRIAGYAAAAALMGLLAWLPFQQGVVDGGRHLVAEMGLMPHPHRPVYAPRTFLPMGLAAYGLKLHEATTDFTHEKVEEVSFPSEKEIPANTAYHVIAASLPSESEARDHLTKLRKRGFRAELASVGPNGMHRVSYGRYDSKETAESMLASVRLSNPAAAIVAAD